MSADIRPIDLGIADAIHAVINEVEFQLLKWGEQHHPVGNSTQEFGTLARAATEATDYAADNGTLTWYEILREEFYESFAAEDRKDVVDELIQVAAVVLSIVRDIETTDGVRYAQQLPNRAEQYRQTLREKTIAGLRERGRSKTEDSD